MTPLSSVDSNDTSLSDRMDEWISQYTLLVVAQENQLKSDQHQLVENDPDITDYPINSYVLFHWESWRQQKSVVFVGFDSFVDFDKKRQGDD